MFPCVLADHRALIPYELIVQDSPLQPQTVANNKIINRVKGGLGPICTLSRADKQGASCNKVNRSQHLQHGEKHPGRLRDNEKAPRQAEAFNLCLRPRVSQLGLKKNPG